VFVGALVTQSASSIDGSSAFAAFGCSQWLPSVG
jgi:hypothetical protein